MTSQIKIISGGQTGVDRAALDAAIGLKIPHGGWCPRGRLAEDGTISDSYQLHETRTKRYSRRTEKNVLDSDATLIICCGEPAGGTLLTSQFAKRHDKPLFVVDLDMTDLDDPLTTLNDIRHWLKANSIRVLNVAGPRESQSPGIYEQSLRLLIALLQAMLV